MNTGNTSFPSNYACQESAIGSSVQILILTAGKHPVYTIRERVLLTTAALITAAIWVALSFLIYSAQYSGQFRKGFRLSASSDVPDRIAKLTQ